MKKLILNISQIEGIFFEDSERFKVVSKSEWEQYDQCQSCDFMFKDTETDIIYKSYVGRCEDGFEGWVYDSETIGDTLRECIPVEEKEAIVKKYVEIDKDKITETETVKEI